MQNRLDTQVAIIGAGPAGAVCAYQLASKGVSSVIIDKATFPRDKVCGDALSNDVYKQMALLSPSLQKEFSALSSAYSTKGVRLYSPNQEYIEVLFQGSQTQGNVCKRKEFDNFLFQKAKSLPHVTCIENETIKKVQPISKGFKLTSSNYKITTSFLIGADGANSIVKKLVRNKVDKSILAGGVRQYFKGIKGLESSGCIELHFLKEIIPGYLWIFPLPNGEANVGLGLPSKEITTRKLNLKTLLPELLEKIPSLKERFKHAEPLEKPIGFGLPLGNKKVYLSTNRVLLLGDAAHLIDPFTGEGIGNAIRSGRVAADHLEACFNQNRFDEAFNKRYDKEIYERMGAELRLGSLLQKMVKYPNILNYVVKKANNNQAISDLITTSLVSGQLQGKLVSPKFYWKLLFS